MKFEKPKEGQHIGGGTPLKEALKETRQVAQERTAYEEEMREKIEKAKKEGDSKLYIELNEELKRKEKEFIQQETKIAKPVAGSRGYKLPE
ncbi:hypothetical protein IIA95_00560 [Patescibacteria group bacterium]|nr:hypothetical protein [Patescibacteria group bacterium]